MKERPIIFSGAMVRAILDGTKDQTRRIVKTDPGFWNYAKEQWVEDGFWLPTTPSGKVGTVPPVRCPYGVPKQRLWVREAWNRAERTGYDAAPNDGRPGFDESDPDAYNFGPCWYRTTDDVCIEGGWKPSIFMPRAASRLTLEIVSVRVERLNDISEDDAKAEGSKIAAPLAGGWWFPESFETVGAEVLGASYKNGYQAIWESINGPGSWDKNPWVWVVEFKRVEMAR